MRAQVLREFESHRFRHFNRRSTKRYYTMLSITLILLLIAFVLSLLFAFNVPSRVNLLGIAFAIYLLVVMLGAGLKL
jgi:uncharacterized membrane protein